MARHALDLGVVDAVGGELVVGAGQLEHGVTAEDQVRLVRGLFRGRQAHGRNPDKGCRKQRRFQPEFQRSLTWNDGVGWHDWLLKLTSRAYVVRESRPVRLAVARNRFQT